MWDNMCVLKLRCGLNPSSAGTDVLKCLRSASTADLMESNLTLSSAQTMTAFAKSLAELGIPAVSEASKAHLPPHHQG